MSLHEKYPIPPDLTEKLDLYISDHFAPERNIGVPLFDDFIGVEKHEAACRSALDIFLYGILRRNG